MAENYRIVKVGGVDRTSDFGLFDKLRERFKNDVGIQKQIGDKTGKAVWMKDVFCAFIRDNVKKIVRTLESDKYSPEAINKMLDKSNKLSSETHLKVLEEKIAKAKTDIGKKFRLWRKRHALKKSYDLYVKAFGLSIFAVGEWEKARKLETLYGELGIDKATMEEQGVKYESELKEITPDMVIKSIEDFNKSKEVPPVVPPFPPITPPVPPITPGTGKPDDTPKPEEDKEIDGIDSISDQLTKLLIGEIANIGALIANTKKAIKEYADKGIAEADEEIKNRREVGFAKAAEDARNYRKELYVAAQKDADVVKAKLEETQNYLRILEGKVEKETPGDSGKVPGL